MKECKSTKKRLTALFLSVLMVCSVCVFSVIQATAFEKQPTSVADDLTLDTYKNVFNVSGKLSTKDIGRIWTDKSVSLGDITLTGNSGASTVINKDADADFLVGLSGLSSAATIVDSKSAPTDTVFVLDLSPKMGQDNKAVNMVNATEMAIRTLYKANPYNRVAIVAYSENATTILPLGRYVNDENTPIVSISGDTVYTNGVVDDNIVVTESFEIRGMASGVDKYTQAGIYQGFKILTDEQQVTENVNGEIVNRVPSLILLSEGEPKDGDTRITNPPVDTSNNIQKDEFGDVVGHDDTGHAQSFAAMMTAAYMKNQVSNHYNEDASVYTIGVNTATSDAPKLARMCLNPKDELKPDTSDISDDFNNYFNTFKTTGKVSVMSYFRIWGLTRYADFSGFPEGVESLAYNDAFFDIQNVSSADEWNKIYEEISNKIITDNAQSPTETPDGAPGTGGDSGYITFTDTLGKYMEIKGMPTFVYAGQKFEAKSKDTVGDTTTYVFEGTVSGNEIYGEANIADLIMTVKTDAALNQQVVTLKIPASLIPLRTVKVNSITDGNGESNYTIDTSAEAYPARMFYSVGQMSNIKYTENDLKYFEENSVNGKSKYFSNDWSKDANQYGTTVAEFTPSSENSYYNHTQSAKLYVFVSEDGTALNTQNAPDSLLPGQTSVEVDGVTYNVSEATTVDFGTTAYYWKHVYYQSTESAGNTAEKLVDYHKIVNNQNLQNNTEMVDGKLHIKAGVNKISRVSDKAATKTQNKTNTSAYYIFPEMSIDNDVMEVHLGNNGVTSKKAPTGSIKITNSITGDQPSDDNQKFKVQIALNNNDGSVLEGEYVLSGLSGGDIKVKYGSIFEMSKDDVLEIKDVPVTTKLELREIKLPQGYKPSYTVDGVLQGNESATGKISFNDNNNITEVAIENQYTLPPRYEVILQQGEGYTLTSEDKSPVDQGGSYKFKFELKEGYSKTEDFAVKVNGVKVDLLKDQTYTIENINQATTVTVEGVKDITAPTGIVKVDTNEWKEFINDITFGLFFKETKDVNITAEDNGSGVKQIQYYLADKSMTKDELALVPSNEWKTFDKDFKLEAEQNYVVYAKLEDNSGNVSYISSNGIVIDKTAPTIEGISNGETTCVDVKVTIHDINLEKVTVNGEEVALSEDNNYVLSTKGENKVVAVDKAGNKTEVTVTLKEHVLGDMIVDLPASCETTGLGHKDCTVCGKTVEENIVIDALGHKYGEWKEVVSPSCEDKGSQERICQVCGNKETKDVDPLGHDWEKDYTVDKEPTCTEDGSKSIHCSRCDATKDSQVIEKLGHKYGDWEVTKQPTCTEAGEQKHVCAVCGNEETQVLEALGHDWEKDYTVDKEPTCTEAGSKSIHCSRCDATKDTQVIEALGHKYGDWEVTKQPTCTEAGEQKHVCTVCGDEEIQVLEALGHDWEKDYTVDKEPTCTEAGSKSIHCSRCDATKDTQVIEALGHKYGDWEVTKQPTCTEAGEQKHVCTVCGNEETQVLEALGHDWEKDYTVDKEPTCTEAGSKSIHCSRCDATKDTQVIEALGHKYGDWKVVKEATYEETGLEERECTVCGYKETREIPKLTDGSGNGGNNNGDGNGANNNNNNGNADNNNNNSGSNGNGSNTNVPATADNNSIGLAMILVLLSSGAVVFIRKKELKNKN